MIHQRYQRVIKALKSEKANDMFEKRTLHCANQLAIDYVVKSNWGLNILSDRIKLVVIGEDYYAMNARTGSFYFDMKFSQNDDGSFEKHELTMDAYYEMENLISQ